MPVLPDDPVSPGELRRQLDRVADRLRILGPRWAARTGPDAAEAIASVRSCLQRLADLVAGAEGRAPRPVPVLAPHALADQVSVLGDDVLTVASAPGVLAAAHDVVAELRILL